MAPKDEARFADLYEIYRAAVWLYCRRRVGADRADDVMADVFLTVWRRIEDAPQTPNALPWLYRISYLTISNHWRTAGRRKRLIAKASKLPAVPPQLLADYVVVREEVREVVALLDKLKVSDAEILKLVAWEHLSTDQVASVLGISSDAAKQRLSRARRRLTDLHNRQTKNSFESPPLLGKEVRGEN